MADADVEVVRRGFELYRAGDPAIADIAHPDIEVVPLAESLLTTDHAYRGQEEVARWALDLARQGFRVELDDMRDLDTAVLVRGTVIAEPEGGQRWAARAAWLVGCRDGKIAWLRAYHSEEQALAALPTRG